MLVNLQTNKGSSLQRSGSDLLPVCRCFISSDTLRYIQDLFICLLTYLINIAMFNLEFVIDEVYYCFTITCPEEAIAGERNVDRFK